MTKILFVCHGNICRSPMAEFIFKNMLKDAGLEEQFEISSAGTSNDEVINGVGNSVYPNAKAKLAEYGISTGDKRARQINNSDYDNFDLLIALDHNNYRHMQRKYNNDPKNKIHLLLDFAGENRDVADPWYTRDFDTAYDDIYEGCKALLDELQVSN